MKRKIVKMPVLLRIDVDRAYLKGLWNHPRRVYSAFPALDSLGYLESTKRLLEDLESRGVKANFFFQPMTLPKKDLAAELMDSGHCVGLHAVDTSSLASFSRELKKIQNRFKGRVRGFTKHGSGQQKLSRKHDLDYDPEKMIEYAKKTGLDYFLGNGENPEQEKKEVDGVRVFPSAFWLDRNYREDKYTVDWLIEESHSRDVIVLMHTLEINRPLLKKEYEKIISETDRFKTLKH